MTGVGEIPIQSQFDPWLEASAVGPIRGTVSALDINAAKARIDNGPVRADSRIECAAPSAP